MWFIYKIKIIFSHREKLTGNPHSERECHLNNTHDRELQKISTVLLSIDILRRINKILKKEKETKVIHNISREKRCNRKTLCSRHWTRTAGRLHVTHNFQETPAEAKLGGSRPSLNLSIEKFRASVVGS